MELSHRKALNTLCFLWVFHCASSNIEREFDYYKEDIDRYTQTLVNKATASLSRQSYIALADTEESFKRKITFINFEGGLQTYNNKMRGLNTLYKDGDISATWETNQAINVEANLAFRSLEFTSDARIRFGTIGRNFSMSTRVESMKITVNLEFPLRPSGIPKAKSVLVQEMGKMSFDVDGLGPLNWLLEGIRFAQKKSLRNSIKHGVEPVLLSTINKELGKIQLPVL